MMHPSTERVVAAARALGLNLEIVTHEQSTRTADEAAAAVGCHVGQIVKSLCFLVNGQPVMALVSGANQLDERKLADVAGVGRKAVKRADADTVKAATGYTIGGVAPFGHAEPMTIYIDADLMQYDEIWAAAGTPYAVFPIAPTALRDAIGATVADLRRDT